MSERNDAPPHEDHLDLVTVYRAGAPADILVAKSVLQASGIDFVTKNEGVQDLFGWGRFPRGNNLAMGPIELQVRSCDAQDARQLLEGEAVSDEGVASGTSPSAERPPYAIPAVGEAIRVFDGTRWGKTVPAVYLGFERVADDYFMHRVRSESGLESTVASHGVYRSHMTSEGESWESLTPKPRVR